MKKSPLFFVLLFTLFLAFLFTSNGVAKSLPEDYWQELLEQTQHKGVERKLAEEARLQLNNQEAKTQANALAATKSALKKAEQQRLALEKEQDALEIALQETQQRLQLRSTALGEVFAVYREEKSNLFGLLSNARYSQQYPQLLAFAKPDLTQQRLPKIEDFNQL